MGRSGDAPCDPGRVADRLLSPVTIIGSAVGLALMVVGVVSDPHVVPAGPTLIIGGALVALLMVAWPAVTAVSAGLPLAQATLSPTAAEDRHHQQALHVQQKIVDCAKVLIVEPDERPGAVERSLESGYQFNKRRAAELELFLLCALVRRSRTLDLTAPRNAADHPVHRLPLPLREAWTLTEVAYLPVSRAASVLGCSPEQVQTMREEVAAELRRARGDK